MKILELRVKLGVFKEMKILEDTNLQSEIEEKFKVIFDQLEKIEKGESIEKIDSIQYVNLIASLSSHFLTSSISDDLCVYFNFLTEVLFNWNANCVCDKKIEVFSLMLNRLIEVRNRLKSSTEIIKDSYGRYIELANWQPPIFDLAIDYFDKLLEDNEKKISERVTK
jgi:hypothetical protein